MADAEATGGTTICELPVQLLARILAVLKPAERFGSAALVAAAWRTAAVLGTDSIKLNLWKVSEAVPKRFDSLSAWLATNSNAGITELYPTMPVPAPTTEQMPVLQLPSLQRLPGLESLRCFGVTLAAVQASDESSEAGATAAEAADAVEAAPAAPHTPVQLSAATALTCLLLDSCNVEVLGLAALTQLQGLSIGGPLYCNLPNAVTSNLRSQLQQALPKLQDLLLLRLFGEVIHDDVLQHLSSLSRLEELTLVEGMFTPASFQQLPQSLTRLDIHWADSNDTSKRLSASTAPGLCALTGLEEFEVRAGPVSMEVLANMTALQFLDLMYSTLEGPGTLSVLTALTQLTYLSLPIIDSEVTLLSDLDAAAVTASSQLVWMDISGTWLSADMCQHMFAAGRQLLQLTRLHVNLDLIHDGHSASLLAACCPNLENITLARTPLRGWLHSQDFEAELLSSMLTGWRPLQHLTSLTLEMQDLPMFPKVWRALASLTQLRVVKVSINNLACLLGALNLASCTRLKNLSVDAQSEQGSTDRVWLDMTCEEAGDGTTSLARQLPQALQQAILQQVSEDNRTPELMAVLVRCAADVQQAQEQQMAQQQGEIDQLQGQIAQQQGQIAQQQEEMAQQQGEIVQLRRELRGVQASLAAVLQKLPGQAEAGASSHQVGP